MTQSRSPLYRSLSGTALLVTALFLSACVFQIDIQQGNLLDDELLDQVEVGMSRSAVEFLLGTPMVDDPFHVSRWDYPYYLKRGRSNDIERSWIVVWFDGDVVSRIDRDVALN